MKKILLFVSLFFIASIGVNAACNDENLNEWAVNVQPIYTLSSKIEDGIYGYAYFISVDPPREDIKIKVIDGKYTGDGKTYGEFYGVGCYTNLEEKVYQVEIYGNEKSNCKNELLKKTTLTVPGYNERVKEEVCEKNPDNELCAPFTDKTKNMTREEFLEEFKEEEEEKSSTSFVKIISYSLYVIVPFALITLLFLLKKKNIKKKEGNK